MRKISANYIFPVSSKPLHNGIIVLDDSGKIIDLIDTGGNLRDTEKLEFYNGIIVPGFVNTHCHLELSHLLGKIEKHRKLSGFIDQLVQLRKTDFDEIHKCIVTADQKMLQEGIVAVGDISNTSDSFFQKQISKLHYHTFVEIFNPEDEKADAKFQAGMNLLHDAFNFYSLKASLTPHAPYSVSKKLMRLIAEHASSTNSIVTIHNQETDSENDIFLTKSGELLDLLCQLNSDYSEWIPTRKNSLESIAEMLPEKNNTILVHNTFSRENDIDFANSYFQNLYWCICPNANVFIENKLPDINLLKNKHQKITVGTDSLAANNKLSILAELKTISSHFPDILLTDLIKWSTLNGAEALKLDANSGSFEIGKTPGVNLIENIDLQNLKLTDNSIVKVLV